MCAPRDETPHKPVGNDTNVWSEEEKRLLRHEAFIKEVLLARTDPREEKKEKPKWLLFLESRGGTALIAALLGGVLVQWIAGSIQEHSKDREFQQAWMQARGSQALAAYKERLDQEQQLVSRSYDLIGKEIQASEDLIDLTGPELELERYKGEERKKIAAERDRIRKTYNAADTERRSDGERLSLLMNLYHHDRPDVTKGWGELQVHMAEYMDCAWTWYDTHESVTGDAVKGACLKERTGLTESIEHFTASIDDASSKAREDWDNPDRLMQRLQKVNKQ